MILVADPDFVVVGKPSGLLVHRGLGRDRRTLVTELRERIDGPLHLVHRLDRGTSGVMIVARSQEIAALLSAQFAAGTVAKSYLVLVRGDAPKAGRIDHPVPSDPDGPRVDAVTSFERIRVLPAEPRTLSIVRARPETGRFHQIRRHLKHIDHPVIGDANYGKGPLNRAIADRYGLRRLALHAEALTFQHPRTQERTTVRDEVPDDLRDPLARMGLEPWSSLADVADPLAP